MPTKEKSKDTSTVKGKGSRTSIILIGIGLMIVVSASLMLWDRHSKTRPVSGDEAIAAFDFVVTQDTDEPDENKPDVENTPYEVPNDMPRRIIIPSLGVNGFVQQVGLTPENAVAVPSNIHVAGWFNDSVLPGEAGVSIIDGHVSGRYSSAIFESLSEIAIGETFTIEFGNLSQKTFRVTDKKQLAEEESAEFLFTDNPAIDSQLNLITCGGQYNRDTDSFPDRVVIVSELL